NVLANDTTNCGTVNTASLAFVGTPPTGFAIVNGQVVYTNSGSPSSGTVTATYQVCNNLAIPCCDSATVTITICNTNAVDDAARVCAGSSVTTNVLANDTTNCGALVPGSLSFVGTPPPGFTIVGGQIVYTNSGSPNSGTVSATYRVCNNETPACCDTATLTVTICNVNAVDDTARVCAGSSVTTNVLANDTTNCGALVPGTLSFVGTPPTGFTIVGGQIVYANSGTPSSGTVTATYRVCNNESPACCDTATLTVSICNVNAVDDTARVCAGSSVTTNVLANDTTNCGALVPSTLSFVGTPPTGFTISGSSIVYANSGTPSSGTVTATYRVCNNESPACCDTATLTVSICSVNAVDDTARVCAGASVTTNVLANDTTNCGLVVAGTLAFVGTPPRGFTISGGSIVYTNPGTPSTGTVTATYRVCNNETPACCDTATLTVTICNTTAVDDEAQICAGTTVSIPVLANDTTNCGLLLPGSLSFVGTPPPGFSIAGGQIVYANPGTPSSGTVTATYRVCNDETPACCDTAVVRVTICAVDALDDPLEICCGDTTSVNVLLNDTSSCGTLVCDQVELVKPYPPGFSVSGCIVTYDSNLGGCPPTATARYRIRGGTGFVCQDEAEVTVTILSRPTAVDDRIDLLPTTTFPLDIDVLANDSPGKGCTFPACTGCAAVPPVQPCAVTIVTNPLFGTATVQPDCTVRYVPGKSFSTGDTFCYEVTNSCGCTARACVTIASCREVDRNTCGSLLLFPEYDNRTQSQTLFSITNGCCEIQDGDLWVEFRFIDALTCQETDFTLRLTPCDTVTFLTSTVNPNSTRGYAYAFAKRLTPGPGNPGGMPIVRNKLIGQALIIDGLEDVEYAMNAVSFLGIGPELADNDDDGDGIRDLNGPLTPLGEYEQAPDEILIPRFLGQDPPGPNALFQSDLLILGLSGGSAFTTTVQFLVYNDSEDVTSQTASFYCWDKRPLVQWAPATLSS
ncbi:MAG: Ig-like domain-containing protein, partial [Vicinamibacterales bacterium]